MLLDLHAHIDKYEESLDAVLKEIEQHSIFTISNSMDLPSYERNIEISKKNSFVLPTFGIHPWNASDYVNRLGDIEEAVEQSPILGEIGLDYYFVEDSSHYPAQRKVLEFFLKAAKEQNKIVNLHTKGAEDDILKMIDKSMIERVIIHWYSGPLEILKNLLSFGAYFSIGVEILYSEHIKDIVRTVPMSKILTETDNPGALKWLTERPGMPIEIMKVIRELSVVKQVNIDSITKSVLSNFEQLIRDDKRLSNIYKLLFKNGI